MAVIGFLISEIDDESTHIYWKLVQSVGVILASVGAFVSSIQQSRGADELIKKNEQIIDLQESVVDTLIGGEAYCFLMITSDTDSTGNWHRFLAVWPPRRNPLYDVRITYATTEMARAFGEEYAKSLLDHVRSGMSFNSVGTPKYYKIRKFGNILPSGYFKLDKSPVTIDDLPFIVDARFVARNGQWHQSIIFAKGTDGEFASADYVVRNGSQLAHKRVTDNFPNKESLFVRVKDGKEVASSAIPFCCEHSSTVTGR